MVNFRWFAYNKYGKFLTARAREYLSKLAKERIKKVVRVRRQVALNSDYNISLRAISINGANEKELEKHLYEFLNSNDMLQKIPFDIEGKEQATLDSKEDKDLISGAVYIELNIRGNVNLTRVK